MRVCCCRTNYCPEQFCVTTGSHRQTHEEKLRTGQNVWTLSDQEVAWVCLINLNGSVFPMPVSPWGEVNLHPWCLILPLICRKGCSCHKLLQGLKRKLLEFSGLLFSVFEPLQAWCMKECVSVIFIRIMSYYTSLDLNCKIQNNLAFNPEFLLRLNIVSLLIDLAENYGIGLIIPFPSKLFWFPLFFKKICNNNFSAFLVVLFSILCFHIDAGWLSVLQRSWALLSLQRNHCSLYSGGAEILKSF